jgi:two-component system CheB/CheR fusion protein
MENLAQEILATLRESLLVLDSELRVQSANHSFYRTFQVGPQEVENRPIYELGNGQWNIPQLKVALQEILDGGPPLEDFAVEHSFPNIGFKAMLLNARRVERPEEKARLVLLAVDDVTEQHEASATIQNYLHKLEWSNRELEDFAYIASHDLQEPLRAIQAFSDRLQAKYGRALDAQGLDYLMRIQKAAGRMRLLISDLLTYSRVTTKGKPFEQVDLGLLARECIADLNKRLEETKGRIEVGELPVLDADPVQMRQLIQNLLENGLKFHRAGEPPLVRIENHLVVPPQFSADSFQLVKAPRCHISVSDNGIGFEEKYTERIFTPFERLHNQNQYPGTGIGLAVCRRIVERHGGSLKAKSLLNQGSTFLITLPLHGSQEVNFRNETSQGIPR